MTPTPPPPEREEPAAGGQELGARREGAGQGGSCPTPTPNRPLPPAYIRITFPSQETSPSPEAQPGSRPACGEGAALPTGRGSQHWTKPGGAGSVERSSVLWFDISLDSMLQFSFCCLGFFIFPGGGRKRSVCEVQ